MIHDDRQDLTEWIDMLEESGAEVTGLRVWFISLQTSHSNYDTVINRLGDDDDIQEFEYEEGWQYDRVGGDGHGDGTGGDSFGNGYSDGPGYSADFER